MGDTSVATVNRHYFNLEDDVMQEIIDGWAVPDVDVFAPDLEPVALHPRRTTTTAPLRRSSPRRIAPVGEARVLPLAPPLIARSLFAPLARRAEVRARRSHARRRRAARLSEHPAQALGRARFACAPFASRSDRFLARETMASFAWNIRDLHCYSVCFAALENSHLVRNLVRVLFAVFAAAKAKRCEVAAHENFRLAARRGSTPRPPA